MSKYRFKKIMQYTEQLEIEAEDMVAAADLMNDDSLEFDRIHDDHLVDIEIKLVD